jgi:hypothetical protein
MSLIAFGQSFGGTVFLAAAQTAFSAGLTSALHQYAPKVLPEIVTTAGATGFRSIVPVDSIAGVIKSYQVGSAHVFYVAAGCAVASFASAWGMGWKSVKKAKVVEPTA